MVEIQRYREDDIWELLELNKTLVQKWVDSIGKETKWEDLTPLQRYFHGGQWNDPDMLRVHVEHFLDIGDILLAWDSGELVGELEYHIGTREEEGQLEKILHIDWMMTHPKHRHVGIGRRLIEEVVNNRTEQYPEQVWTEPEDESIQFYKKNGFEREHLVFEYRRDDCSLVGDDWRRGVEKAHPHVYGRGSYTTEYTYHLTKILGEYAKMLALEYPVKSLEVGPDGTELFELRFFTGESYLFIASDTPLTSAEQMEYLNGVLEGGKQSFHFSSEDGKLDWEMAGEELQLVRTINR